MAMPNLHGFEIVRDTPMAELNGQVTLYRHIKSGAQLMSIRNDDANKVFGINFFTPPVSSNGIAHIMEHSVLCGSRKYPVKEPFVELIKGSLATFLNAFTFPDKTCYPVASQNLEDFYNLIDVYLDAVFYPRITPETLQQEGWHYELDQADAPLVYKGVVFNEMKGNYSAPDSLLGTYSQQTLFPDTHYGLDSGGDPKVIPDLTYAEFKAFHETYYHPSNAFIFFYGDDDADKRLAVMDSWLSAFEARPVTHGVKRQAPFTAPKRVTLPYGASDDETDAFMTVNWLLTNTTDSQTNMGLQILAYMLTGTPASPLRKALIDSGLGEGLAGSGIDDQLAQMTLSTGLKGIEANTADQIEALIFDTLRNLVEQGIAPDMIEAALNTIEFRLRENNTGRFPRGISLMITALSTWLYGGDPFASLAFEAPLAAIRDQANKGYFEQLIKTYLIDNVHRSTVVLIPDPDLRNREDQVEAERLARTRSSMSQDDLARVLESTEALKLAQETPDSPEALATIPVLTLADLDRQNKLIPTALIATPDLPILHHDLFTNGIVYIDVGFDLHLLPANLLPYVELFSQALLEMGTHHENFVTLTQRIGRKTGGLHTETINSMSPKTGKSVNQLFLRGKGTVAQVDALLEIINDILTDVQLDNRERFKQIVLEAKSGAEAHLIPGGHQVAFGRLRSGLNEADWAAEQMTGLEALFFWRKLIDQIDSDWGTVLEALETIRRILVNRQALQINVTIDGTNWVHVKPKISAFIANQPTVDPQRLSWNDMLAPINEGLTIPAGVNYVAKGTNVFKLGYQLNGSALVIVNYLRTTWFWEKVRVQGGAYGGFPIFSRTSGTLGYVSYRDPNLGNTLDIYDGTGDFLRGLQLSDSELTRAIIGTIGEMDTYLLPDAKGYTALSRYLIGETDADRQVLRDQALSTTAADFKAFADVVDLVRSHGHVTVLGSEEDIAAANTQRDNFLATLKVM